MSYINSSVSIIITFESTFFDRPEYINWHDFRHFPLFFSNLKWTLSKDVSNLTHEKVTSQ